MTLTPQEHWYCTGPELIHPGRPAVSHDAGHVAGWGLPVWRDEFDGDLSAWNVRDNWLTFDTARGMAANAAVSGGQLHLQGTWLATPEATGPQGTITHETGYIDTRNITSSGITTPVHFSQQYGRWEVRCQTPTGPNTRGSLAAFWLRTDSGGDRLGEIDIMEAWGYGGTMAADHTTYVKDSAWTTFHSNTLSETTNGKPYKKTYWRHYQSGIPRDTWEGMHTYAFEYMPDYCTMTVDGATVFDVTPATADPVNGGTLAWLWDPDFFGNPLHMRMNLHVGPSAAYWGLPDPDNRQWTTDPLDFAIDYVRVYAPPA